MNSTVTVESVIIWCILWNNSGIQYWYWSSDILTKTRPALILKVLVIVAVVVTNAIHTIAIDCGIKGI